MQKEKVLLLLSGGKDSAQALEVLQRQNYEVFGLCISGIQGKEQIGARAAAEKFNIPLKIVSISFFDEETWNPFKLIFRDLAMGLTALIHAKKMKATFLATGVKLSDLENPKLKWLKSFLDLGSLMLRLFGLNLIFPLYQKTSPDPRKQISP